MKKVSGGTTTVYSFSGTKVTAEYVNGAAPASPTREYIYARSQLLAKIEGGVTNYYHADHLSVRVTTDTNGNIAGQQAHYPYGESWYASSTTTKWQFTSYERDAESVNDYAIFRYHVNRLGRFSSPDPLAGSIRNPQSLNHYAYVLNDPCNLSDPLGLDNCNTSNPTNRDVINFINSNLGAVGATASALNTKPEFILALAYTESHNPSGGLVPQAAEHNNFFGVLASGPAPAHYPPFTTGVNGPYGPMDRYYFSFPGPGIQASLSWFQSVWGGACVWDADARCVRQCTKGIRPDQSKPGDPNSGHNHENNCTPAWLPWRLRASQTGRTP